MQTNIENVKSVFARTSFGLLLVPFLVVAVSYSSVAQTPQEPVVGTTQQTQHQHDAALLNSVKSTNASRVQNLLRLGANANARDRAGTPAIVLATQKGATSIVQMLLAKGAAVDARDRSGTTALMLAFRQTDLMRLLLQHGANPNLRPANEKHKSDMSLPDDMTVLMLHVWIGTSESIRLLLDNGARVNDVDANGWSALSWTAARQTPQNEGRDAALIAAILLNKGADVDLRDKKGNTPLINAARFLKADVLAVLVKCGAKVNATNERGETALMVAVDQATELDSRKGLGIASIQLLLSNGADVNQADKSGETSLMRAQWKQRHDIESLLRTGKLAPLPRRLLPRPKDLMQSAKPLLAWNRDCMQYKWKSPTEMLISRRSRIGERFYDNWFRRDVRTGHERRVTQLKAENAEVAFSPDGHWALFTVQERSDRISWKAVALDTTRTLQGAVPPAILKRHIPPYLYATSWTWAPDNRRWIWAPEALGQKQMPLVVFSLNSLAVREIKVAVQNKEDELLPAVVLGFTAPNRVLSTTGKSYDKSSTRSDLFEFDISTPSPKAQQIDVVLPATAKAQAFLSPRGNRLAWLLRVEDEKRDFVELWLSRSDGSQMRGVGATEIKTSLDGFRPDSLQWRPDGKQLTFINGQKLYAIDVTER